MRYAARRDASEKAIVSALRKAGCDVYTANDVDLFVYRAGRLWGLECKTPGRRKQRQEIQQWLCERWNDYAIVTTPAEALEAVGL